MAKQEPEEWSDPEFNAKKAAEFNELMSKPPFSEGDVAKQAASQVVDFMFAMMKECDKRMGEELDRLSGNDAWMRARLRGLVATGILGSAAASAMGALECNGVNSIELLALMFVEGERRRGMPPEQAARLEELGAALTALAMSRAEIAEEDKAEKPICEG